MKLLMLLCIPLFTGCSSFRINPDFPDAPRELRQKCAALNIIPEDETKLSTITKIVSKNYQEYHNCSVTVEAWNIWYDEQRKIFKGEK